MIGISGNTAMHWAVILSQKDSVKALLASMLRAVGLC